MSIPCSAPSPVPTITAVGVARPRAHGHAMISTATNIVSENAKPKPSRYHIRNEIIAIITTAGTKYADILSASACIGALLPWASSTSLIICASMVSEPIFVALNLNDPVLFIVAPIILSPLTFSTGMLSPVIIDSSTEECPSVMMPSTGIFWPGFTTIISPTVTSSIGISTSLFFLMTIAVFACSPINFFIASDVLPFATASRYLPRSMNAINIPAIS